MRSISAVFAAVLLVASLNPVHAAEDPVSPTLANGPKQTIPIADAVKASRAPSEKQIAARARLKACGTEWKALKASGSAGTTTWKAFSKTCLARSKD